MSKTLVWETKTMVAEPQIIFWMTRKIVPMRMKIFSFKKTMVSGIRKMVCAIHTIFTRIWPTVRAAEKAVSVTLTIFCVVK